MNLLYASKLCSPLKFKEMFENTKEKPGQAVQKYHLLMVEGLKHNPDTRINVISALPVSRKTSKQLYYSAEKEIYQGTDFRYLPFINVPVFRQIFLLISGIFYGMQWANKRPGIIITDVLDITVSIVSIVVAWLSDKKCVGIVTDVPTIRPNTNGLRVPFRTRIITRVNMFILDRFDAYVFLTDQMNDLLNTRNKPYVVIEGQVDRRMAHATNNINDKYPKKTVLYAGALKEIYGLKLLTEAFIKADLNDAELYIYGTGDNESELREISVAHPNIKYFGLVENNLVVQEQIKSTLLVNPRFTHEEYTKYSFPSKNMEYMVSGTPVLTTCLLGMPEEYKQFVYLIEDETVVGLAQTLKLVLSKSREELHQKGLETKQFVLATKNNVVQAEKIMNMITKLG